MQKLFEACCVVVDGQDAASSQNTGCYWTMELVVTEEMRRSALDRIARRKAALGREQLLRGDDVDYVD